MSSTFKTYETFFPSPQPFVPIIPHSFMYIRLQDKPGPYILRPRGRAPSCYQDTRSCADVHLGWCALWCCCPSFHGTTCYHCFVTFQLHCYSYRPVCVFHRCFRARLEGFGCTYVCIPLQCLSQVSNVSTFSEARTGPVGGQIERLLERVGKKEELLS